jgi:AraC-like DNA-binding protein
MIMAVLSEINTDLLLFNYALSTEMDATHQIHCHNVYEIYYFIEGEADYLVEGKLYNLMPHSILLLSPHVFHGVRVKSEKPYRRFFIHFNPDLINPQRRSLLLSAFPSSEKHTRKEVYYENIASEQLLPFFEALTELSVQPDSIKLTLLPSYIEAILAKLTLMSRTHSPITSSTSTSETITDIIAYLNDNLSKHITLDHLAEHFCISKHYLNRAFRKASGTTVGDYLIYKRVIYAQQLLMNGASASEAAASSGFNDYSVFYRAYCKHLGHSPINDRRDIPKPPTTNSYSSQPI